MKRERTAEEVAARKARKERRKAEKAELVMLAAKRKKPGPGREKPLTEDEIQAAVDAANAGMADGYRLASILNPTKEAYREALKKAWSRLPVERWHALVAADNEFAKKREKEAPKSVEQYPFDAEPSDHCETGPQAYADVEPLLELLAERCGKPRNKLRVWDPYYCKGAVKKHLGALGFTNVRNDCEDFYEIVKSGTVPKHDVVVTNPPYSEPKDGEQPHPARLLRFLRENGKPYLINMPEYCASAAYFREIFEEGVDGAADDDQGGIKARPLFLCPYKRYHFWSPMDSGAKRKSNVHRRKDLGFRNSPFVALWYVNLAPRVERKELLSKARAGELRGVDTLKGPAEGAKARLCAALKQLPEGREKFGEVKGASEDSVGSPGTSARDKKKKAAEKNSGGNRPAKAKTAPKVMTRKERRKLERAHLQWGAKDAKAQK